MLSENRDLSLVAGEKEEASKPTGDFLAMVSSATVAIFTWLSFFRTAGGDPVRGYRTPYGMVSLVVGAACAVFALSVLGAKFVNDDFRLSRSPGWAYSTAASVVVIMSILALVMGYRGYQPEYSPVLVLGSGLFLGFAGLMKF